VIVLEHHVHDKEHPEIKIRTDGGVALIASTGCVLVAHERVKKDLRRLLE